MSRTPTDNEKRNENTSPVFYDFSVTEVTDFKFTVSPHLTLKVSSHYISPSLTHTQTHVLARIHTHTKDKKNKFLVYHLTHVYLYLVKYLCVCEREKDLRYLRYQSKNSLLFTSQFKHFFQTFAIFVCFKWVKPNSGISKLRFSSSCNTL